MTQFSPFTHNFLQSILSSIDSKDPVVANAWLDTLLDVIDLLPNEVLGKEVLGIAISKANAGQPTFSRLGSCQLIGRLGLKLEKEMIQSDILPLAQSLSQDSEWTIRASMCTQLSSLARGLTHSGTKIEDKNPIMVLLSMLVELSIDEEEAVRVVAVETASSVLPFLDYESISLVMIPLLRRMGEQAIKLEDKTLPLIAQHWARISRTLQAHLSNKDKEWFVEYYYRLALLGGNNQSAKEKPSMPDVVAQTDNGPKLEIYAEVRHACAVNSSAMIPFIGVDEYAQNINALRAIASDPHFVVRRAVAANLLDICRQLHPFGKAVHPIFFQLLVDPFSDVICTLVPHIGAIIEHFTRLGPQSPFVEENVIVETCEAVLRCEEQVMNCSSWRVQADMLSQLAALPLCLPCNTVHDFLIPRLWHRIETMRPLPCRIAAAQTLMLCVRSERRLQERQYLCSQIINKLISASTCHRRMLFLRVCPILFDLLSRKFIRQHFFLSIIRLAGDKVPNVRLRFASLLPKLHSSLKGLNVELEKGLIVQLDSTIRWMVESEKDRDVNEELSKFFRWVEEQDKKVPTAGEEEEDVRKEQEEQQLESTDSLESVKDESKCRPFFVGSYETISVEVKPTVPISDEKPITLDPSTDDFYRDAGVRLSPLTSAGTRARNAAGTGLGSRIPSIHGGAKNLAEKPDGSIHSKLKQPSNLSSRNATGLPHFGIARGVQQIPPKPSIAYGVTASSSAITPPMRNRRESQLNSAKSRSQENLNTPPKTRTNRPISCIVSDLPSSLISKTSPFQRNRFRASMGAVVSKTSSSNSPISSLPPRSNLHESKPSDARGTSSFARKSEPAHTNKFVSGSTPPRSSDHSVKLSDMKSALPITSYTMKRNSTTADGQSTTPPTRPAGNRIMQGRLTRTRSESTKDPPDTTVADMLQSLDLCSPMIPSSKIRQPVASANRSGSAEKISTSPQNSRSVSPTSESLLQKRIQPRRSLNIPSPTPPPPPPRKNFGNLSSIPRNHNNNNLASNHSKLPVPALKRNSCL